METSRRQICTLLALSCSVVCVPALSESIPPQDLRVPAEIAGDVCKLTDPSDPHQILGPNPAHADCLTVLYPSAVPTGTFAAEGPGLDQDTRVTGSSLPMTGTLWLSITAIAMLVLAGFNSRKRHRHLPVPGLDGPFDTSYRQQPREQLHTHSEGSRWNED